MYSINKKSTRKTNVKRNKKTKRTVGKNSKKRTSKKNKQKKNRKTKKGGSPQTYYWSPMRKLQYNPNLDNSLSDYDAPRQEVTNPAYNCKNPVTVVQAGGEIIVGNNKQTVGIILCQQNVHMKHKVLVPMLINILLVFQTV